MYNEKTTCEWTRNLLATLRTGRVSDPHLKARGVKFSRVEIPKRAIDALRQGIPTACNLRIVADSTFLKSEGEEEWTSIGAENPPISIVRECISDRG